MRRRKIVYIIGLGIVFMLNVLFVDYQFMLILILMVVFPLISWICFQISKHHLTVFLKMQDSFATVNSDIKLQVKAVNDMPMYLSGGILKLSVIYSNCDEKESVEIEASAYLDQVMNTVRLHLKHCGVVRIEIERYDVYDFLRMFHSVRQFAGGKEIVSMPEIIRGDWEITPTENVSLNNYEYTSYICGGGDEISDYREFRYGDEMKHIHWKLSAVNPDGEYIVKHFFGEENKMNAIFVDLTRSNKSDFRILLDRVYTYAYSIGAYFAEMGEHSVFFCWNDGAARMEYFEFYDTDSLARAMVDLMKIETSPSAREKMLSVYDISKLTVWDRPIWITSDYFGMSFFRVINVADDGEES